MALLKLCIMLVLNVPLNSSYIEMPYVLDAFYYVQFLFLFQLFYVKIGKHFHL